LKQISPLDLFPSNGEVGYVFIQEVLFGAHAEDINILLPAEVADVKVEDLLVCLRHQGEELVMIGVGPLHGAMGRGCEWVRR